jgi:peptide-methionine (S)-S-oxide reductase
MKDKQQLVSQEDALVGRTQAQKIDPIHFVNQSDMTLAADGVLKEIIIGMGCFWGAERLMWQQPGVVTTSVGYCGGFTPNPTYDEVCTGRTGHVEVVRVVYDSTVTTLEDMLTVFWENHDPTQGMRQGGDIGTQYRSVVYTHDQQDLEIANQSKRAYQLALQQANKVGPITTEIQCAAEYYFADDYHQQYLAKNPNGYCGLGGTGVCFI